MKLPHKVSIIEVGPRDGFQNVKNWIETGEKLRCINMLLDAGVDLIEAASFVSPKAVEQMKDAAEIIGALRTGPHLDKVYALVPNAAKAESAAEAGVRGITVVISASEEHNLSNIRKTTDESVTELKEIRARYPELKIKLDVGTAFGCPFSGRVPQAHVFKLADAALALRITDIALCDTVGVANPLQVSNLLASLDRRYAGIQVDWIMHFHNTRGLAAANTLAALEHGVTRFESAAGGLGGCPFAPGASGNMATEDLLFMLREMGVKTRASLEGVLDCSEYMRDRLGLALDSKLDRRTANKTPGCRK